MNTIKLTEQKFLNFNPIKYGKVHTHNNLVYKCSPYSKETMSFFEQYRKEKIYKQLATATSFLLDDNNKYWGFTMQYYKNVQEIKSAIESGNITKKEITAQIINALVQMDSLGFSYYDITPNNIKVNGKRPIFFDLDETIINPSVRSYCVERRNLIMLILEIYLEENINSTKLKALFENGTFKIFSKELQRYLESAIFSFDYSYEYPYQLVDELEKNQQLILKK